MVPLRLLLLCSATYGSNFYILEHSLARRQNLNAISSTTTGSIELSTNLRNASSTAIDPRSSDQVTTSMNCSASWNEWLLSQNAFSFGWTSSYTTFTYHNMTAPTTTLCDGHPRIVGGSNALVTTATGTTSTMTSEQKSNGDFTVPTPICMPPEVDQTALHDIWQLWVPHTKPERFQSFTFSTTSSGCGDCSIWGGTVSLLRKWWLPFNKH